MRERGYLHGLEVTAEREKRVVLGVPWLDINQEYPHGQGKSTQQVRQNDAAQARCCNRGLRYTSHLPSKR